MLSNSSSFFLLSSSCSQSFCCFLLILFRNFFEDSSLPPRVHSFSYFYQQYTCSKPLGFKQYRRSKPLGFRQYRCSKPLGCKQCKCSKPLCFKQYRYSKPLGIKPPVTKLFDLHSLTPPASFNSIPPVLTLSVFCLYSIRQHCENSAGCLPRVLSLSYFYQRYRCSKPLGCK